MANKRISDLTALTTPSGSDVFPMSSQGATYKVSIDDLSFYMTGEFDVTFATNTRLQITGQNLTSSINSFSGLFTDYTGKLPDSFATDSQLTLTGQSLTADMRSFSGTAAVLTYGNQTISGIKNFRTGINIFNFSDPQRIQIFNATGTNSGEFGLIGWENNRFIVGTRQSIHGRMRDTVITGNNVIINASGALFILDDVYTTGNIFISGNPVLTGIDLAPYALENDLQTTGINLQVQIDELNEGIVFTTGNQLISGTKIFAENIDLYNESTPQRLRIFNATGENSGEFAIVGWENDNFIFGARKSISGSLRDVVFTGNNLIMFPNEKIIMRKDLMMSGYIYISGQPILTGQRNLYAFDTNLLGTGLSLSNRINTLSGNAAVLTYGAQRISGLKTFTTGLTIENGLVGQSLRIFNKTGFNTGEFSAFEWRNDQFIIGNQQSISGELRDLIFTGRNIIVDSSGVFVVREDIYVTGNIYVSGSPVVTGFTNLYEYSVNARSSGKYLDDKLSSLSGSAILRYNDQFITGGYKNFSGQSVVVNFNSGAMLQVSGQTVTPRDYATKNLALLYAIAI